MASFYGNMKNNSRASFIFDRVYPSRVAMEEKLAEKVDGKSVGDGIFINRYVLIDYHYTLMDDVDNQDKIDEYYVEVENGVVNAQNISAYYTKSVDPQTNKSTYNRATTFTTNSDTKYYQRRVFVDRFRPEEKISNSDTQALTNELLENDLYYAHRYADWEKYRASYDCTVWMKIYADNKERYIMVAELDAKAPILEFVNDAPSCIDGTGHFDVRASTDLNYVYYIPKNWDMILNKYNPLTPKYELVTGLSIGDNIEDNQYYELIEDEYVLSEDTQVIDGKTYYKQFRSENDNDYWYYQDNKDSNDIWFEDYILTTDQTAQLGKTYYQITFKPLLVPDDIQIGQSIKNMHYYINKYQIVDNLESNSDVSAYYEYIDDKYILTTDITPQYNYAPNSDIPVSQKIYYEIVPNQYEMANETTVLDGVQYYTISKVEKIKLVEIGQTSVEGYYELNNQKKTFNDQVEYPYFNAAGFDPKVSNHVSQKGQGIFIKKVPSTQEYPVHRFVHAGILTTSTWLPNRYYTYHGKKVQVTNNTFDRDHAYYISTANADENSQYELVPLIINDDGQYQPARALSLENPQAYYYDEDLLNINNFEKATQWDKNTAYYEITIALNDDGTKKSQHDDDTYRVDVYLPELGNTVANIYDVLYGAPIVQKDKNDGYNNLIGYCSKDQWELYNLIGYCTKAEKESYTDVSNLDNNGEFGTGNDKRFDLTTEQISALSPVKEDMAIIGYCTAEQLAGYSIVDNGSYKIIQTINDYTHLDNEYNLSAEELAALSPTLNEEDGYIIPVYEIDSENCHIYSIYYMGEGNYWAGNKIFDLTDEEFNQLSPEIYPGVFDIPVYLKTDSNVRPYNQERLVSSLAPPYDNLDNDNNVSVGWTLTLLKRYLSELRYLAHGKDGEGGIGLQSDWVLEDDESFGYIYNKPTLITNYVKTNDNIALPNKSYYKEEIINGEVVYTPLNAHYNKLTGVDYQSYYYQIINNVYLAVNNQNCDEAVNIGVKKCVPVVPDASSYVNYYVFDSEYNYYIRPVSFNEASPVPHFNFVPLEVSDYSNWFYSHQETQYFEITENNYNTWRNEPNVVNTTIYKKDENDNFVTFGGRDYIDYYFDLDEDPSTPRVKIDESSYTDEKLNTDELYDYDPTANDGAGVYFPATFIGYYYTKTVTIYDPITNENYDSSGNQPMYKYNTNTNEYLPITNADYIGYYYNTDVDIYIPIKAGDNGNYYRDRQKYKYNESTGEYSQVTMEDFASGGYYYLTRDTITNELIYEEINSNNWQNIDTLDIYTKVDAVINVGTDLGELNYVVYELPRSFINSAELEKSNYIRCTEYTEWDPDTHYYMMVGGEYKDATYTICADYIRPMTDDTINLSNVQYNYGYQIVVNENHQIIQRTYSNCEALTTNDNVGLIHVNTETGKRECVNTFSVILTSIDPNTNEVYEIHSILENMQQMKRNQLLDLLNNILINVNSYDAEIQINTIRSNWPTEEEAEENEPTFFYGILDTKWNSFYLDQYHFNQNKTFYFTLEKVPIEQEDYEIHNIWNNVLEQVLQEP